MSRLLRLQGGGSGLTMLQMVRHCHCSAASMVLAVVIVETYRLLQQQLLLLMVQGGGICASLACTTTSSSSSCVVLERVLTQSCTVGNSSVEMSGSDHAINSAVAQVAQVQPGVWHTGAANSACYLGRLLVTSKATSQGESSLGCVFPSCGETCHGYF